VCDVNVLWRHLWYVPGSGSSKRLAKKDAALAMLQFISDGGEMFVSQDSVDVNQELGLQSEVSSSHSAVIDQVIDSLVSLCICFHSHNVKQCFDAVCWVTGRASGA